MKSVSAIIAITGQFVQMVDGLRHLSNRESSFLTSIGMGLRFANPWTIEEDGRCRLQLCASQFYGGCFSRHQWLWCSLIDLERSFSKCFQSRWMVSCGSPRQTARWETSNLGIICPYEMGIMFRSFCKYGGPLLWATISMTGTTQSNNERKKETSSEDLLYRWKLRWIADVCDLLTRDGRPRGGPNNVTKTGVHNVKTFLIVIPKELILVMNKKSVWTRIWHDFGHTPGKMLFGHFGSFPKTSNIQHTFHSRSLFTC